MESQRPVSYTHLDVYKRQQDLRKKQKKPEKRGDYSTSLKKQARNHKKPAGSVSIEYKSSKKKVTPLTKAEKQQLKELRQLKANQQKQKIPQTAQELSLIHIS